MLLDTADAALRAGQIRAIQARYETQEHRNPDDVAHLFLPRDRRLACAVQGRLMLQRLRRQPFYAYVLARTRYYDQVFADAMADGTRYIVIVGGRTDTRAHRFRAALASRRLQVLECDRAELLYAKRRTAAMRFGANPYLAYQPVDLKEEAWGALAACLAEHHGQKTTVIAEGVAAQVPRRRFERFLDFLAERLPPGSTLAYDGPREGNAGADVFALPAGDGALAALHGRHGFALDASESSEALSLRLARRLASFAPRCHDSEHLVRVSVR